MHLSTTFTNVVPVFVFGLPRSGTTLVDQIITSHSKVTGLGEIELVIKYGSRLIKGCKESSIKDFRNQYICVMQLICLGVQRNVVPVFVFGHRSYITDKLCFNFLAVINTSTWLQLFLMLGL